MVREELIAEISMRRDIPMDDVEEVLDEQDVIFEEERQCKKKKRTIICIVMLFVMVLSSAAAVYILDRKQKIDMEEMLKKYIDKINKLR